MQKPTATRAWIYEDLEQGRKAGAIGPVWCAKHHFSGPWPCGCPPGPQMRATWTTADEILYGGARGGGKSEIELLFMLLGNKPSQYSGLSVDSSYINSPQYRGLFIRESLVDLEDFLDRADQMYGKAGAKLSRGNPPTITFPSGAKFYAGYLGGEHDISRYLSSQYHRIVIEQGEQIAKEVTYTKLLGSLRSVVPGIHTQIMMSANPGSGPGQGWIKDRFIDLIGPDGQIIEPMTEWTDPDTGDVRIFIPAGVWDNPYLTRCPDCGVPKCDVPGHRIPPYVAKLMGQPEHIRKAWLEGDWNALAGGFFPEFRDRRLSSEPYNALHVVPRDEMKIGSWWPRWMAMDWGRTHPSIVGWFTENPETKQIYLYKELAVAQLTAQQVGTLIAQRSIEEMVGMVDKVLVLALSPDAFGHKESPNSLADQIRDGIQDIFGPKSAFVMDFDESEKLLPYEEAWSSMLKRRDELQGGMRILIIKAHDQRIAGWERLRDFLRWKPLQDVTLSVFSPERAKDLLEKQGTLQYLAYMRQFEQQVAVLPKIKFAKECRETIKSIKVLIFATGAKEGTGDAQKMDGDDGADMARYGVMAYEPKTAKMPEGVYVSQEMDKLISSQGYLSPTSLIHASMQFAADHKKKKPKAKGFTPNRHGSRNMANLRLLDSGM